jgi:hypothetical protein
MIYPVAVETPTPGEHMVEWLHGRGPSFWARESGVDPVNDLTLCGQTSANLTVRAENWEQAAADRRYAACLVAFSRQATSLYGRAT